MSANSDKDTNVPEGTAFLELVWEQEDQCEKETDDRLPKMGERAPACIEQIGTVLSFLDRMASCWWVCRGGRPSGRVSVWKDGIDGACCIAPDEARVLR